MSDVEVKVKIKIGWNDWKWDYARDLTPQQRANLRSWGIDMPDPPVESPMDFAKNLDAIARGELKVEQTYHEQFNLSATAMQAARNAVLAKYAMTCLKCGGRAKVSSNYCAACYDYVMRQSRHCTDTTHTAECTESKDKRGICGHRGVYNLDDLYGVSVLGYREGAK
jgi:hypothetical protein